MTSVVAKLRRNLLIKLGAWLGAFCLFIFLTLIPKFVSTKALARAVDSLYGENEQMQQTVLSTEGSGKKLQEIREKLIDYRNRVPPRDRLPKVLDQIASRAQADGLSVSSLKPLRNVPYAKDSQDIFKKWDQQPYEVVISLQVSGQFFEIGQYLSHLENGPYKLIIKSLELKTRGRAVQGAGEPELDIKLTVGILMRFNVEDIIS
jgi:Tfp pilus assembly protein PilO